MAILRNVEQAISEWKEQGWAGWEESAKRITKFSELSGIKDYVFDNAEFYASSSSYLELLNDISVLLKNNYAITEITLNKGEGIWDFEFKINGASEKITLEIDDPEWFEEDFIKDFNKILKKHKSTIFGRFVFPTGKDREDQSFHLCFISDETYSILKKNKPKFA
jgi:hypothetical protein